MGFDNELILKLVLSLIVGGVIGAERELRSKSAGFRTLMLICMGATMFTIFSQVIGEVYAPERIASNIVVGIGFLGAGVIFRGNNRVNGITTAASIWVTAALGMGIGCGYYLASVVGCFLVIVILYVFSGIDQYVIDRINQVRNYKIKYPYEEHNENKYEQLFRQCHLRIKERTNSKKGNMITSTWIAQGKEKNHHRFIKQVLKDGGVQEFDF